MTTTDVAFDRVSVKIWRWSSLAREITPTVCSVKWTTTACHCKSHNFTHLLPFSLFFYNLLWGVFLNSRGLYQWERCQRMLHSLFFWFPLPDDYRLLPPCVLGSYYLVQVQNDKRVCRRLLSLQCVQDDTIVGLHYGYNFIPVRYVWALNIHHWQWKSIWCDSGRNVDRWSYVFRLYSLLRSVVFFFLMFLRKLKWQSTKWNVRSSDNADTFNYVEQRGL